MRNSSIAEKGQKIAEEYFTNKGYVVDRVYERDNSLPYDISVRKRGSSWKKVQVKTTRGPKEERYIFRTRKTKGSRRVPYEKGDLDMFVLVDSKTRTLMTFPFSDKSCFSFSQDDWEASSEDA